MKERGEGRKERRGRMREQLARETPKKNHNTFFIYFLISEYTHTRRKLPCEYRHIHT